jgi:hypothetical protein
VVGGLSAAQVASLHTVHIVVTELAGGMLAGTVGDTVYIDRTAAGLGWSVGRTVPPGKVDFLTVSCHELGHELGLGDLDAQANPGNVMDGTLAPGVRRLPGA